MCLGIEKRYITYNITYGGFLKWGYPQIIIHFRLGFSLLIINHFSGTPILGNHHIALFCAWLGYTAVTQRLSELRGSSRVWMSPLRSPCKTPSWPGKPGRSRSGWGEVPHIYIHIYIFFFCQPTKSIAFIALSSKIGIPIIYELPIDVVILITICIELSSVKPRWG